MQSPRELERNLIFGVFGKALAYGRLRELAREVAHPERHLKTTFGPECILQLRLDRGSPFRCVA